MFSTITSYTMTAHVEDLVLDGNAAAGLLQELLPFEMTTARTVCAGCAAVDRIGALRVYANGPGVVVRCLACGGVQLRVVGAEAATGSTCGA